MIERVEPARIDFELRQGAVRDLGVDGGRAGDGGEVAHPAQQPRRNAWRAAGAPRDLVRALGREIETEKPRPSPHDLLQFLDAVEFESDRNAEALPQRRGEKSGPGRRADEGEAVQGRCAPSALPAPLR